MTRQHQSSSAASDTAQRQRERLLRPLEAPKSLSSEVVDRLAEQIMSGKLPVGAKLPSEQEMMKGMGVSRTVVREAVAALRARGLVVTRQGGPSSIAMSAGNLMRSTPKVSASSIACSIFWSCAWLWNRKRLRSRESRPHRERARRDLS